MTPRPRGADFTRNQTLGGRAELAVRDWVNRERSVAIPYGRSQDTAFEPGEAFARHWAEHRSRERVKRPDLLVIKRDLFFDAFPLHSPEMTLAFDDEDTAAPFVAAAWSAIEVKWSASERANNFTIKDEELAGLAAWSEACRTPIMIVQAVPDGTYAIPLAWFLAADSRTQRFHSNIGKRVWMVPLREGFDLGWAA